MKPISIIRKLNESTDWEGLKAGLSSCKSASDVEELMLETMDSSDYSKYCDYHYEIDDSDKSSLQWAKSELRKLSEEKLKETDGIDEAKSIITNFIKSNNIDGEIKESYNGIEVRVGNKVVLFNLNPNKGAINEKRTPMGSTGVYVGEYKGNSGPYWDSSLRKYDKSVKDGLSTLEKTLNNVFILSNK